MSTNEDVVRKVRALWANADDPALTPEARASYEEKARDLMAKHAIDEMVLAEASGVEEAVVLADILLFTEEQGERAALVPDQRMKLAHYISMHHRCQGIVTNKRGSVNEDGTIVKAGKYLLVVGFKSDVDMVRLMYNALGGDMIMAMIGEPTEHMNTRDRNNYYINFCDGYADRIERRLAEVEHKIDDVAKSDGSLLPVLRSRKLAVQDEVKRRWPNLGTVREKRFTNDPAARERGKAAADRANIGSDRHGVGGSRKGLNK